MTKLSERYYKGVEVQRILGITEPALRNLVAQRRLRKIYPPGKKTGVYLKEEVDTYAEKWLAFLAAEEPPKTTFETAKQEDMDGVYSISKRAIAPVTMGAELRKSWLAKCPESCYVVKHNDKVVAFFHLLPVEHTCLMRFMNGEIRGWDISAEDVQTFETGKPVECLAIIASEPEVDETTRKHYVRVLLRGVRRAFGELGKRGVIITKIYATSETPTGIAMAIHAGMEPYGEKLGKRIRFVMDVENSTAFLLGDYQQGLNEWKQLVKGHESHKQGAQTDSKTDSKSSVLKRSKTKSDEREMEH